MWSPRARRGSSSELRRVVRPGGIVALFEHNPLNPLTRVAVSRCEFDEGVTLAGRTATARLMTRAGLAVEERGVHHLHDVAAMVGAGRSDARWCPAGAQYYLAREAASVTRDRSDRRPPAPPAPPGLLTRREALARFGAAGLAIVGAGSVLSACEAAFRFRAARHGPIPSAERPADHRGRHALGSASVHAERPAPHRRQRAQVHAGALQRPAVPAGPGRA